MSLTLSSKSATFGKVRVLPPLHWPLIQRSSTPCVRSVFRPVSRRLRVLHSEGALMLSPPAVPSPIRKMQGILARPFADAARSFLPPQHTVCFSGRSTVRACLLAMDVHHLRSCLVCRGSASEKDMSIQLQPSVDRPSAEVVHKHFQMIDLRDVLKSFLLTAADEISDCCIGQPQLMAYSSQISESGSDLDDNQQAPPTGISMAIQNVLDQPVSDVANLSGRNYFVPCWDDDPFQMLIRSFEISPRVPVFNFNHQSGILKLVRVFSATDLFTLLNKSDFFTRLDGKSSSAFDVALAAPAGAASDQAAGVCDNSLSRLFSGAVGEPVRSGKLKVALETDTLLETIQRLVHNGYTAMPVVDAEAPRRSIGVISVRDFRPLLLRPKDLRASQDKLLMSPTLNYVSRVRQLECLKARFPSISVNEKMPLRFVVHKMLAADIQRIFLVDDYGLLTGIFSRTDLGRLVARTIESLVNAHVDIKSDIHYVTR